MENKEAIELFYERGCEIFRKHRGKRDRAKQEIKSYVEKVFKENDHDYFLSIRMIISHASDSNDLDTANALFEMFYDDFSKYEPDLIPVIAFELEGLEDLWHFEMYRGVQTEGYLSAGWIRMKEIFFESNLDSPLLIIGETGTSKELMAKAIHRMGKRRDSPFAELNCAAIPRELLESELFGYEKGGHSRADKTKKGLFEFAGTGTLFLDEIGNMPIDLQYKLLKAIEEKKIRRLGSESEKGIDINARFIAAAQPGNIEKILPDLLYRFGYPDCIETPTLRERIGMLGERIIYHSLRVVIKKMNLTKDITLSTSAKHLLLKHDFRGNYRELENILRSGLKVAQAEGRTKIMPRDFKRVLDFNRKFFRGTNLNSSDVSTEKVKLKDIIDHAEKMKASIIESKIIDVTKNGRSLKSILFEEGLSEGEYLNFRKKVVNITGKKIRECSG